MLSFVQSPLCSPLNDLYLCDAGCLQVASPSFFGTLVLMRVRQNGKCWEKPVKSEVRDPVPLSFCHVGGQQLLGTSVTPAAIAVVKSPPGAAAGAILLLGLPQPWAAADANFLSPGFPSLLFLCLHPVNASTAERTLLPVQLLLEVLFS